MDHRRDDNGLLTFIEHWGFFLAALIIFVAFQLLNFFTKLSGISWIWTYAIALGIAGIGSTLVFYSKLSLYRQGRFFTFGSRALPEMRRPFYRWGYVGIIIAVMLLLGLSLSRS